MLRSIQRETDIAYLFIAHDLAVVRHVSDRVAVMYLGEIVEIGPRDALYESPMHPYTISLLSAVPIPNADRERGRDRIVLHGEIGSATDLPSGCRFHPRCYKARLKASAPGVETVERNGERLPSICVQRQPEALDAGSGHETICHFPERGEDRSQVAQRAVEFSTGVR